MIQAGCVWTCKPCGEHRKAYVCCLMTPCSLTLIHLFLYREGKKRKKKKKTCHNERFLNKKYELMIGLSNSRPLRLGLNKTWLWLVNWMQSHLHRLSWMISIYIFLLQIRRLKIRHVLFYLIYLFITPPDVLTSVTPRASSRTLL